jgi:LytS/YehU family sensor histidine kinase
VRVVNESDPAPAGTSTPAGEGLGLANIRGRLDLLFGADAGLELTHRPGGACVTAWMPFAGSVAAAGSNEPAHRLEAV